MENLRGRARGREGGGGEEGKAVEREGEWLTERRGEEERSRGEEERSGAFPRTVGPRGGVGCPALISACSGSGFPFQSLPKPKSEKAKRGRQRGERWADNERDLCIFLFFSSGRNKKKKERGKGGRGVDGGGPRILSLESEWVFALPPLFFFFLKPIKRDKQRVIHRFHTGVGF